MIRRRKSEGVVSGQWSGGVQLTSGDQWEKEYGSTKKIRDFLNDNIQIQANYFKL